MIQTVIDTVERHALLKCGDSVLVALSGGADSMALLLAMLEIKDRYNLTVKAAHINHLLRGEESFRDENFVKEICESLSVPLEIERIDVSKIAGENHESIELCARNERYKVLLEKADGLIATAHTASDVLETVIANLTRGSGIAGVSGIPIKRDNIIRPLISVTREDVEKYLEEKGVDFVTDSTNSSVDYTRNKIRHLIVPKLKEINPSVETAVERMTRVLKDDRDFLESESEKAFFKALKGDGLLIKEVNQLHPAIKNRVLRRFIEQKTGTEPDYKKTREVLSLLEEDSGKRLLYGHFFAYIFKGVLRIIEETEKQKVAFRLKEGEYSFFDRKIIVEKQEITESQQKVNKLFLKNSIDCDKIIGEPELRTRIDGDFIKLYSRGYTKKLKKLFLDAKIPIDKRDKIAIIADNAGVIWVEGFGVAERVATSDTTKEVLIIRGEKDGYDERY